MVIYYKTSYFYYYYHQFSEAYYYFYYIIIFRWTEVTRSDALEMIVHHLVTIALILLSYLTRFSRIGASILLVHDFADIFLEMGKCFNYICKSREDKVFFCSFMF